VAAAPSPGPGVDAGRVPRLGGRGVPDRPRPARPPRASLADGRSRVGGAGDHLGPAGRRGAGAREGTKTARFLALAAGRYGPLEAFPLADVSRVSAELAGEAGLHPGTARAALRRHVLALRNGSPE
jgi:hypothetical protein